MDLTPSFQALLSVLSLGAFALAVFALGLLFYGYLADRVIFESAGNLDTRRFGVVDGLVATVLTVLFMIPVVAAIRSPSGEAELALPSADRMVAGVVSTALTLMVIVGIIFGMLTARRIRWRDVFGLDRLGPGAVIGYAVPLLMLAFPLIWCASALSNLLLVAGGSQDNSTQELVRFLGVKGPRMAQAIVAVSAVVAAPILEEFIFRGYFYGVVRRYAGVTVGIIFNATLFAAIHTHLPSFGGLFILAVCLTLAYEWTGSIFVPITMHALFNLLSVVSLLQSGGTR